MKKTILFFVFLNSFMIFAKFDKNNRSVTSSANVLSKNSLEVGFWSLLYGVTEKITLTIPSLSILVKNTYTGLRYEYKVKAKHKLVPYFGTSYEKSTFYPKAGVMYGYKLNEKIQMTIGCEIFKSQGAFDQEALEKENKLVRVESSKKTDQFCYLNADYYTDSGNLLYAGWKDQSYIGFTWAFTYTHIGIIIVGDKIPDTPLPYIYWKF